MVWYAQPCYVFLKHLEYGACVKYFTNLCQIRQMLLCRLSQIIRYSSITIPRQKVCHKERYDFEENVSYKKVSGRTVQIDEITVSSSLVHRKETLEVISKF